MPPPSALRRSRNSRLLSLQSQLLLIITTAFLTLLSHNIIQPPHSSRQPLSSSASSSSPYSFLFASAEYNQYYGGWTNDESEDGQEKKKDDSSIDPWTSSPVHHTLSYEGSNENGAGDSYASRLSYYDLMALTTTGGSGGLPAPNVLSAQIQEDVRSLIVKFDQPTNRPGEATNDCAAIFTTASLTTVFGAVANTPADSPCPSSWLPSCIWTTSSLLTIEWSPAETENEDDEEECYVPLSLQLTAGSNFSATPAFVFGNNTLRDALALTEYATGSFPLSYTLPLSNPLFVPLPGLVGSSDTIGECDDIDLVLDEPIYGAAGRPWSSIVWTMTQPPLNTFSANVSAALQALLSDASDPEKNSIISPSSLRIPHSLLPTGQSYTFSLQLTNWLGFSGSGERTISKSDLPLPIVKFKGAIGGGGMKEVSRYEDLRIDATIEQSSCGGSAASATTLTILWSVISTDPNATQLFSSPNQLPPLFIPSGSLIPGVKYTFTLSVSAPDSAAPSLTGPLTNSASFVIHVKEVPAPVLLLSQFDDAITSVLLTFDSDTNCAGMIADGASVLTSTTNCALLLPSSFLLSIGRASQTKCTWLSNSQVRILFGSGALLDTTIDVQLLWDRLKSKDGYSTPSIAPSVPVRTSLPLTPLLPVPLLRGSLTIGRDESILLSGETSTGHGGRDWKLWNWTLLDDGSSSSSIVTPQAKATIRAHLLVNMTNALASTLLIPNYLLTPGGSYVILLTLTNFLSYSSTITRNVSVSLEALPHVAVLEDPPVKSLVSDGVTAKVGLALPSSWPVDESAVIVGEWKVLPPHDTDVVIPNDVKMFQYTYEPPQTANVAAGQILTSKLGTYHTQSFNDQQESEAASSLPFSSRSGGNMFLSSNPRALLSGFQHSSSSGDTYTSQSKHSVTSQGFDSSSSSDPSSTSSILSASAYFILPPYLLSPGITYEFVLSVSLSRLVGNTTLSTVVLTNTTYNSAAITITISRTPLVASITGGNRLITLKQSRQVQIDARYSYDPDSVLKTSELFASNVVVTYKWSCVKVTSGSACFSSNLTSTYLGKSQMILLLPPKLFTDAIALDAPGTAGGFMWSVLLAVQDGTNRTASANALITVTTASVPNVSIKKLWIQPKPNVDQVIKMQAIVQADDDEEDDTSDEIDPSDYIILWSLISPLTKVLQSTDSSTGLSSLDLVLRSNTLEAGVTYVFQVSIAKKTSPNNLGRASVTVTTNLPPSGGECSTTNKLSGGEAGGYSIDESFVYACKNWNTETINQPLSYSFVLRQFSQNSSSSSSSSSYTDLILSSSNPSPSLTIAIMPSGLASLNYLQTIIVQISDKWGCTTQEVLTLTVKPSKLLDGASQAVVDQMIAQLQEKVLQPAAVSGNINAFAPTFVTVAALLPTNVNASDASSSSSNSSLITTRNSLLSQVALLPNQLNTLSTVTQRLQLTNVICGAGASSSTSTLDLMNSATRTLCSGYVSQQIAIVRSTQYYSSTSSNLHSASASGESQASNISPTTAIEFNTDLTKTVLQSMEQVMKSTRELMNQTEITNTNSSSTAEVSTLTSQFHAILSQISQGLILNKLVSEEPTIIRTNNLYMQSQVHDEKSIEAVVLSDPSATTPTTVSFPTAILSQLKLGATNKLVASTFFTYQTNLYAYLDEDSANNGTKVNQTDLDLNSNSTSTVVNSTILTTFTTSTLGGIVSISLFNPSTNASNAPVTTSNNSTDNTSSSIVLPPASHLNISDLSSPIRLALTHDYYDANVYLLNTTANGTVTLSVSELWEYRAQCRWFDTSIHDWNTAGCYVDSAHSSPTHTVCLCTHLTDFNVHFVQIEKDHVLPDLLFATRQDIQAITWTNVSHHPIPLICIILVYCAYLFLLPLLHRWDISQSIIWLEGRARYIYKRHKNISYLHICERWAILYKNTFIYRHQWLGVIYRRPGETFNSVQKLTCCVALLLGSMAVSAFFRGEKNTSGDVQDSNNGDNPSSPPRTPTEIFIADVLIGIYSSLALIPVKIIFIELFRRSGPSWKAIEKEYQEIKHEVMIQQVKKLNQDIDVKNGKSAGELPSGGDGTKKVELIEEEKKNDAAIVQKDASSQHQHPQKPLTKAQRAAIVKQLGSSKSPKSISAALATKEKQKGMSEGNIFKRALTIANMKFSSKKQGGEEEEKKSSSSSTKAAEEKKGISEADASQLPPTALSRIASDIAVPTDDAAVVVVDPDDIMINVSATPNSSENRRPGVERVRSLPTAGSAAAELHEHEQPRRLTVVSPPPRRDSAASDSVVTTDAMPKLRRQSTVPVTFTTLRGSKQQRNALVWEPHPEIEEGIRRRSSITTSHVNFIPEDRRKRNESADTVSDFTQSSLAAGSELAVKSTPSPDIGDVNSSFPQLIEEEEEMSGTPDPATTAAVEKKSNESGRAEYKLSDCENDVAYSLPPKKSAASAAASGAASSAASPTAAVGSNKKKRMIWSPNVLPSQSELSEQQQQTLPPRHPHTHGTAQIVPVLIPDADHEDHESDIHFTSSASIAAHESVSPTHASSSSRSRSSHLHTSDNALTMGMTGFMTSKLDATIGPPVRVSIPNLHEIVSQSQGQAVKAAASKKAKKKRTIWQPVAVLDENGDGQSNPNPSQATTVANNTSKLAFASPTLILSPEMSPEMTPAMSPIMSPASPASPASGHSRIGSGDGATGADDAGVGSAGGKKRRQLWAPEWKADLTHGLPVASAATSPEMTVMSAVVDHQPMPEMNINDPHLRAKMKAFAPAAVHSPPPEQHPSPPPIDTTNTGLTQRKGKKKRTLFKPQWTVTGADGAQDGATDAVDDDDSALPFDDGSAFVQSSIREVVKRTRSPSSGSRSNSRRGSRSSTPKASPKLAAQSTPNSLKRQKSGSGSGHKHLTVPTVSNSALGPDAVVRDDDGTVIDVPPSPVLPPLTALEDEDADAIAVSGEITDTASSSTQKAVGKYGDYDPSALSKSQYSDDVERIDRTEFRLPGWCLYLAYVLSLIWCLASGFVILLYGLKFDLIDDENNASSAGSSGWSQSSKWLANVAQTIAQDLIIIDPLLIAISTLVQLWLGQKLIWRFCCCIKATGDRGHEN